MADITTPILSLVKPEVNAPHTENTWGYDINRNFDKLDSWAGAFAADVRVGPVLALSSRAAAIATHIPPIIMSLQLAGYTQPGDGGEAWYTRSDTSPSHSGKFQSADGAWWEIEKGAGINLLALAMPDRTGYASAAPAFQEALRAAVADERLRVKVPAGTYNIDADLVPGPGIVDWDFAPVVTLTGAGVLPFHQKMMVGIPIIPTRGLRRSIWHGTEDQPERDGPDWIDAVTRVDQSLGPDDQTFLLGVRFTGLTRLAGGTGWIQANKTVVEDLSTEATSQSVASANIMYKFGKGAGWSIYGECHGYGVDSVPVTCELDVSNYSGTNYLYNEASPLASSHSKNLWLAGFGWNSNTFSLGICAGESTAKFGCGIYIAAGSLTNYAMDIQSQTTTGIRFKYGMPTGGVGIDFGQGAFYHGDTLTDGRGCMNIWNHLIRFGPTGSGWMCFNTVTGFLEFGYNGALRRTLDLTGAYVPL